MMIGWLCLTSHRRSTSRSFRDGTPIHCPLREALFFPRYPYRESNPGPSHVSPLHDRCATPALYDNGNFSPLLSVNNLQYLKNDILKRDEKLQFLPNLHYLFLWNKCDSLCIKLQIYASEKKLMDGWKIIAFNH